MLSVMPAIRVYVATGVTDRRKSFDTFAAPEDAVIGEGLFATIVV